MAPPLCIFCFAPAFFFFFFGHPGFSGMSLFARQTKVQKMSEVQGPDVSPFVQYRASFIDCCFEQKFVAPFVSCEMQSLLM